MNLSAFARCCTACAVLGVAVAAGCGSIAKCLEGEPMSIRQWRDAKGLFEKGRYEEAAIAFRAWLADYHDSEDVLRPFVIYQLAECYRLTRDYERAAECYTSIIRRYAKSPHKDVRELVDLLARPRLDDILPKTKRRHSAGKQPAAKKP